MQFLQFLVLPISTSVYHSYFIALWKKIMIGFGVSLVFIVIMTILLMGCWLIDIRFSVLLKTLSSFDIEGLVFERPRELQKFQTSCKLQLVSKCAYCLLCQPFLKKLICRNQKYCLSTKFNC